MKTTRQLLAAAALIVTGVAPALAQGTTFQNGSFDAGQTGWTLWGDAQIRTTGSKTAVLSTATTAYEDDAPLPAGFNNNSGVSPVNFYEAPSIAGLLPTALDIGGYAIEASAISQDFFATAGDTLSIKFDWAFLSTESINPDFAFIAINDTVVKFTDAFTLPNVSTFNNTFGDFNDVAWGWSNASFSYTANASGAVRLVLGVVDLNDDLSTSELRLDNISVSAVPEPETIAMLLAGLGVIGAAARRRAPARTAA